MALVTVETPIRSRGLVSLASMKAHLGITDSSEDELVSDLIDEVTSLIADKLGPRYIVRAKYRERFRGNERPSYRLHVAPVLTIHSATLRGDTVDVDQIFIADSRSGLIHRDRSGFVQSETDVRWSQSDPHAWDITYTAGWLVPSDDVSGDTAISFDGTAQTVTRPAGWPLLVAGDWMTPSGAAEAENVGTFEVLERTSETVLTLVAGSGIVDESAGASIDVSLSTLPGGIVRAARELASSKYHEVGRDASVSGETMGPLSIKYGSRSASSEVDSNVERLLEPFRVPDSVTDSVRA